jgi:hypothetical protein
MKLTTSTLTILAMFSASVAAGGELQPYEAVYETELNGMNVHVKRNLKIKDSRLTVSNEAKRFLFGLREVSVMTLNGDGSLSTLTHEHRRKGVSHKHDKDLSFNWDDNTVTDALKPEREPLPVDYPAYDKLNYLTKMRLDLIRNPEMQHGEYNVTNGVRNRIYTVDRAGEETLKTRLGKLRTIRFDRAGDDDQRKVVIWVAPDWNFLLVRVDITKEPGADTEKMILKSAKLAGKKVVGL